MEEPAVPVGPVHHRRNGKAPAPLVFCYSSYISHLTNFLHGLIESARRSFSSILQPWYDIVVPKQKCPTDGSLDGLAKTAPPPIWRKFCSNVRGKPSTASPELSTANRRPRSRLKYFPLRQVRACKFGDGWSPVAVPPMSCTHVLHPCLAPMSCTQRPLRRSLGRIPTGLAFLLEARAAFRGLVAG
jgi:hypothetical protein